MKKIICIFICILFISMTLPTVISLQNKEVNINIPTIIIRQPAEFERMESALIRYPFNIPYEIISEISEDINVITIVASESEMDYVENLYIDNNVNINHTSYMITPSDTGWTRDYGPWFIFNQTNNNYEVIDFEYNRPSRPNDDNIPYKYALNQSLTYNYMDIIHTGGNYMTDGQGISVSTDLVWTENPTLTHDEINQTFSQYLGIGTYHVVPDVNGEYIEHVDCWGKYLSTDTILIREVPVGHSQYDEIEDAVDYFENQLSCYGTPYTVVRVYTPNNEPYTNSLILNDKVLVPITGSQWDDEAILSYQNAMPGYEVLGFTGSWESTDALHCRAIGIPDRDMLYIKHIPSSYYLPSDNGFYIEAEVIAYSNTNLLPSYPKIIWKNSTGIWNNIIMTNIEDNIYGGYIPSHPCGQTIYYYINAQDASGRTENHPYIGASDPHKFTVTLVPDIWVNPTSFNLTNSGDVIVTDLLTIGNDIYAGETLNFNISCTNNGGYNWLSVNKTSGSLAVNQMINIMVIADTTGLSVGNYYESIIINTNDPDEQIITIPVHLNIVFAHDAGVVSINNPSGTLPYGTYSINATLKNYGNQNQNNLLVNCTIMQGIFGTFLYEDFSGSFLPEGWTQEESSEWAQHTGNNAGGVTPEAYLYWYIINGDYACLNSKPVNTIGAPTIKLSFNHSIDHYTSSFNCRILARADSDDSWMDVTPWTNPITNDVSAQEITIDISNYIGEATQVRFEFEGDNYNLNDWYLDDVHIYSPDIREPGDIVYTTENLVNIGSLQSKYIEFSPQWQVNTNGIYAIKVTTKLLGDQNTSNDICVGTVEIFDDASPPVLTNIKDYPDPQIIDGYVNISLTAIDETGVNSVHVDINGPAGFTPINVTMLQSNNNKFYYYNNYSIFGNYSFFIWASDTLGHSVKSSTYIFTILNESYLSTSITLIPGWNLITIPVDNGWYASDIADNVTGCTSVVKYNPVSQSYWFYLPGYPAFDFPLVPGNGYFVQMTGSDMLSLVGLPVTDVNVSLKIGWNLLGWYTSSNTTASSLCNNITGCQYVVKWVDASQSFWFYIPGFPAFDFSISRGMGIFVKVNEESFWYGEG